MDAPQTNHSGAIRVNAASPGSSPGLVANAETLYASVEPRPLDKLLDAICEVLQRYVFFQLPEQVIVTGLWVIHTWVFEAFDYTPYLHVHSVL
jgi:hypothetical protein